MKRKNILSSTLVVSAVLILLAGFGSTVRAQQSPQAKMFVADSGVVSLTPNQKLRVSVTTTNDNDTIGIRFRRCTYAFQAEGLLAVNSTRISPVLNLASNQTRFVDEYVENGLENLSLRVRVGAKRPDFVVTFQIINVITGETQIYTSGGIEDQDSWIPQ
jgi:hypothetical protein